MNEGLGSRRIRAVLDPVLLAGTLIATISGAGLALSADPGRANSAIQTLFILLLIPNLVLIGPYVISIGRQGFHRDFPLLGVDAATTGCAGFALMIGLAVGRPMTLALGLLGLAAGLVLIGLALGARFRRHLVQ